MHRPHHRIWKRTLLYAVLLTTLPLAAQVTPDDYQRANQLRERFRGLVVNVPAHVNIGDVIRVGTENGEYLKKA